MTTFEAIWM